MAADSVAAGGRSDKTDFSDEVWTGSRGGTSDVYHPPAFRPRCAQRLAGRRRIRSRRPRDPGPESDPCQETHRIRRPFAITAGFRPRARRRPFAPRAEALLYAADRAHNVATVVRPALERGQVVIQDRYLDSSVAYQGAGRVLSMPEVRDVSLWASEGLLPHLTVLLDLDPGIGRARLDSSRTRYDRLESEATAFHARVRSAYLELAAAEPERFLVLDASLPVAEIQQRIRERVSVLLDTLTA